NPSAGQKRDTHFRWPFEWSLRLDRSDFKLLARNGGLHDTRCQRDGDNEFKGDANHQVSSRLTRDHEYFESSCNDARPAASGWCSEGCGCYIKTMCRGVEPHVAGTCRRGHGFDDAVLIGTILMHDGQRTVRIGCKN